MDKDYMKLALEQALMGGQIGEVPIGVVIVKDNKIISSAHNEKELMNCATRHAEIVAIERASATLGDWRLIGCTMYSTLEPCAMCTGAIINSRLDKLIFGAYDPKAGCVSSLYRLLEDNRFNHMPIVEGGIMQEECGSVLSEFFKNKRLGN